MSMTSKTEAEASATDTAESSKASSSGLTQLDRPIRRNLFRSWSSRLGFASSSSLPVEEQSTVYLTESQNVAEPNEISPADTYESGMEPPNTTKVDKAAEQLAHHYSNPQRIPGVKLATYVYPHADSYISAAHRRRFPVIIDIFQQNLRESSKLSLKNPANTEFRLKMCGTDVNDAQPSILVYHPSNDLKTVLLIMKILSRWQVREQYASDRLEVCFRIYMFLGPSFQYLGHYRKSNLNIHMKGSSFPGALLVSGDGYERVSTITCGIRFEDIDDKIFALLPAHAFEQIGGDGKRDELDGEYERAVDMLPEPGAEEGEGGETCKFANVEYEINELMKYENMDQRGSIPETSAQHPDLLGYVQRHVDTHVQAFDAEVIKPNRIWGRPKRLDRVKHSNLDWALIEIEESEHWQATEISSMMHEASNLSDENRAVKIVTSRGSLHGTIYNMPTFIANSSDISCLCEVWIVTTTNPNSTCVGDSGALVVDCLTGHPYGYVIAVNHFRELYIMPLKSVLRQISDVVPFPSLRPEVSMTSIPNLWPNVFSEYPFKSFVLVKHLFNQWLVEKLHKLHRLPVAQQTAAIHQSDMSYADYLKIKEQAVRHLSLRPFSLGVGQPQVTL